MTISQIASSVMGKVLVDSDKDIGSFYCGDFLSRVMSKAPSNCGWLTIMNNINVAAVAVMADIWLVILCEGITPDQLLLDKCRQENIALISTAHPVFECCVRLAD